MVRRSPGTGRCSLGCLLLDQSGQRASELNRKQGTPPANQIDEMAAARAAAQDKLMALRREFARQQGNDRSDSRSSAAIPQTTHNGRSPDGRFASPPDPTRALARTVAALPDHLGWGSDRLTQQIRRALAREQQPATPPTPSDRPPEDSAPTNRPPQTADFPLGTQPAQCSDPEPASEESTPSTVKLFPDIALAMLRGKQAAAGRLWLLLRHLDRDGRGWVTIGRAARMLSSEGSALRICGRRQLSNLLATGEGLYWERTNGAGQDGRIWLRSAARVAAGLGVERLGVSPVAVPVKALTGGIGSVRAHLFASFHSGRQGTDHSTGRPRARGPIARATLQSLSDASPNAQRAYERRAGVQRRATFAVGPPAAVADTHEVAWRRGRALFHLTDREGRYGRPGRTYLAWQLPNEYAGPHARLARGRMKRINRALAGLLVNGITGNSERQAIRPVGKRFCGNAKAAAVADRKRPAGQDLYWRAGEGAWHWWPASDKNTFDNLPHPARQPDLFRSSVSAAPGR